MEERTHPDEPPPGRHADQPPSGTYRRGSDGLEFDRVATFSDSVFAIAMTLLSIGLVVPTLKDATSGDELWEALGDRSPEMISFFVSFTVVGYYWAAHHRFIAQLVSTDRRLISQHLPYLALVALAPYPTEMLGRYPGNPVALSFYAVVVGGISTMEWVMFQHARRGGHLRQQLPDSLYRWGTVASLTPGILFLLSIPVAFLSTTAAFLVWVANIPAQVLWGRLNPYDYDRYMR